MGLLRRAPYGVQPLSGGRKKWGSRALPHSHIDPWGFGAVRWRRMSSQEWEESRCSDGYALTGWRTMNTLLFVPERISGFGTGEDETVTGDSTGGGWGLPKWRKLGEKRVSAWPVEWIDIQ